MVAKILSISLPQDLNDEVVSIATEERRTISEVFREAIRQYAAARAVNNVRKAIKRTKVKYKQDEIEDIVDKRRK